MLYNSAFKVGLDLAGGLSLVYFSASDSDVSVINAHDEGRRLQQSFYGAKDNSVWAGKPWCWNPVQAGSIDKARSHILSMTHESASSASASLHPRNWAGCELMTDVIMSTRVMLQEQYVHVAMSMEYKGGMIHPPTQQELPALFLARRFARLWVYDGQAPWTGEPARSLYPCTWQHLSEADHTHLEIPEKWIIYEDEFTGEAVGVMSPLATNAATYRVGHNDREQDPHSGDCSYVAPNAIIGVSPGQPLHYDVYLALGTVSSIRAVFGSIHFQREADAAAAAAVSSKTAPDGETNTEETPTSGHAMYVLEMHRCDLDLDESSNSRSLFLWRGRADCDRFVSDLEAGSINSAYCTQAGDSSAAPHSAWLRYDFEVGADFHRINYRPHHAAVRAADFPIFPNVANTTVEVKGYLQAR